MSRTKKGKKSPGYDYWSRRPNKGTSPGPVTKKITHRMERIESAEKIRKEIKEIDDEAGSDS